MVLYRFKYAEFNTILPFIEPIDLNHNIWLKKGFVLLFTGLVKKCSGVPSSTIAPMSMKMTLSATG